MVNRDISLGPAIRGGWLPIAVFRGNHSCCELIVDIQRLGGGKNGAGEMVVNGAQHHRLQLNTEAVSRCVWVDRT